MKKGNNRNLSDIKVGSKWPFWSLAGDIVFTNDNGQPVELEVLEYGEVLLGASFVVLKDTWEPDLVASFVLVSHSIDDGYIYRCIYSDFGT